MLLWRKGPAAALAAPEVPPFKIKDIVVYRDDTYYSSFPSIVKRPNGELLGGVRRAPDRRRLGETQSNAHRTRTATWNWVRSADGGQFWSATPGI